MIDAPSSRRQPFRWRPTLLLLALLLSLAATPVAALERQSGEHLIVEAGQTVDDDLALAGETITVAGHVRGDLFAAAQSITIQPGARVDGDAFLAGNNIVIGGVVGGSVRAAGNLVQISGAIEGNLTGFASQITLDPNGRVGGNWISSADTALVEGQVGGSVTTRSEYLQLGGTVGRDMELWVQRLAMQPTAQVGGDLIYSAPAEQRVPNALVQGAIQHRPPAPPPAPRAPRPPYGVPSIVGALFSMFWLGGLLLVGLLIGWLFPGVVHRAQTIVEERPLPAFGLGLIGLIAGPILAVMLLVTIIGIPLGLLGLAAYAGSLFVGWVLAGAALAGVLLSLARRQGRAVGAVWLILLGIIGLHVLVQIPFLGGLLAFFIVCLGFGTVILLLSDWLGARRTRQATPAPM